MRNTIQAYLLWLLKPPRLHDLWTWCGVWILDGVAAGLFYRLAFIHLLRSTTAGVLAGLCAMFLVALLLNRMGFSKIHAILVSLGGLGIAVANWPTIDIGLSTAISVVLTIGGMIVSLPLFCRGMETIWPKGRTF